MPTLTYDIEVSCDNCWVNTWVKIPRGRKFIEYRPKTVITSEQQSGYFRNDGSKTISLKRCEDCGCATLKRVKDE